MSTTTFNPATLRRIVRSGTNSSFGSRPGMRRHHWTELDLQELTLAYLEHRRQMPLWKIAEMLQFSFSSPKLSQCEEDDDAPIVPLKTNTRTPSVQAIISKLMDCVYLETGGQLGYESVKPSLLHCQVWEHVKQSQKHREMIQAMKLKSEAAAQPRSRSRMCSIGKVRGRNSDDECESNELPPAKRRKIILDNDDNDIENDIENDKDEQSKIQAVIENLSQRLANLSLQCSGVFAEIESIRSEITSALLPHPPLPPHSQNSTAAPNAALICSKCDRTIEGELGGFSVCYADRSQPEGTIECYDCCPLSPSEIEFVTRRQAELEAEYEEQGQQPVSPVYSDYDSDEYWQQEYNERCDYDHSEECS